MIMEIIYDFRYKKVVKGLSSIEQARILKYQDLFADYNFKLPSKYLKKLYKDLWELRPGQIRLLLVRVKKLSKIVFVHCFKKESQKTPKNEIKVALKRWEEYEKQS